MKRRPSNAVRNDVKSAFRDAAADSVNDDDFNPRPTNDNVDDHRYLSRRKTHRLSLENKILRALRKEPGRTRNRLPLPSHYTGNDRRVAIQKLIAKGKIRYVDESEPDRTIRRYYPVHESDDLEFSV